KARKWAAPFVFTTVLSFPGVFLADTASAARIDVGDSATGLNCIPFGCDLAHQTQYIYGSDLFADTVNIDAFGFWSVAGQGNLVSGSFDIRFSVTDADPADTNLPLEDNFGEVEHHFTHLTLDGGSDHPFSISGESFQYDPGDGNLLIDIRADGDIIHEGSWANFAATAHDESTEGMWRGRTRSEDDPGVPSANWGMTTSFWDLAQDDPVAIPNPNSLALLMVGLLSLYAMNLRPRASGRKGNSE
ncbi:hypothetical protein, partial [Aquisalimonas sp.]